MKKEARMSLAKELRRDLIRMIPWALFMGAAIIVAALLCLAVVFVGTARAATIMPVTLACFTTTEAINILANEHKKKPQAYGRNSSDFLVQLWLADSGAYTVLVSSPQGMSCELSSGQEWGGINSIPKGDKS